jgi:SAM-dependent methyltransferase
MATPFRKVLKRLTGIAKSIASFQLVSDGRRSSPDEIDYHAFFEAYRVRLLRWNQTPAYQYELDKLRERLRHDGKILDYGCGTGYAVEQFRNDGFDVYGYDRFRYVDGSPAWYRTSYPFLFDQVYFMHSFAHIDDIDDVLYRLRPMMNDNGELIVITPNRIYLDYLVSAPGYVPDTTVVIHYDMKHIVDVIEGTGWKVTERTYIGLNDPEERLLIRATL